MRDRKFFSLRFLIMWGLCSLILLLLGCNNSDYHVALYKDTVETKEAVLALFPSSSLQIAMENCETTIELYKSDDKEKGIVSPITGSLPVYYCLEYKGRI